MGYSSFDADEVSAKNAVKASTGAPVFVHTANINSGKATAAVHATLNPLNVTRECRDSDKYPYTIPIIVVIDMTGSMQHTPKVMQENLVTLMGAFIKDNASGKKYLGNYYPSVAIAAIDDYDAMIYHTGSANGSLQFSNFENGNEIDNNLENLWFTGNGGGTNHEDYQLALYFIDKHVVTDAWEKRRKKGYVFVFGDELSYSHAGIQKVAKVIGDNIQEDISVEKLVKNIQEKYNLYFATPSNTYNSVGEAGKQIYSYWQNLLGGEGHVHMGVDPEHIVELIISLIALQEGRTNVTDLIQDNVLSAGSTLANSMALYKPSTAVSLTQISNAPVPAGNSSTTITLLGD